jgi:hypothetical protein
MSPVTRADTPNAIQEDGAIFTQSAMNDLYLEVQTANSKQISCKWMLWTLTHPSAHNNPMPNNTQFAPAPHPIDALGQHFALVRQTFGCELPSATHLQSNEGQRDNEVQFTIDGGGDITARAWSASELQWVNVGEYSYRRRAIEGALGVRQLKGQKIGSVMPRNQIELFIALARQFEEENSIATISPTVYESTSSRNRPPPVAVPLVSPRPHRPLLSFNPGGDLGRSFSSTGYGSHLAGPPTVNTFVTSHSGPSLPQPQRSMPKLSGDRVAFLDMPLPSAPFAESQNSSATNLHNISPLSRRFPFTSTAATTFESASFSYRPAGSVPALSTASTFDESVAADLAKERRSRAWEKEQLHLQHGAYNYSSLGTSYGALQHEAQSVEPQREMNFPQYGPLLSMLGSDTRVATPNAHLAWFKQGMGAGIPEQSWPSKVGTIELPAQAVEDDFSWDNVVSGRPVSQADSQTAFAVKLKNHATKATNHMSACSQQVRLVQEPNITHVPVAMIGDTEIDESWEDRKVRIWSALRQSLAAPEENVIQDLEMWCPNLRGPFFTAADDPRNGTEDGNCVERLEQIREDRTEILKEKIEAMRGDGGSPLDAADMQEMATDPRSHMLWAVKLNLMSYKEAPSGEGDYFQRQFKKPKSELIDQTAAGHNSFFTVNCPSSDEVVVFKGRSSQPGSSSASSSTALAAVGANSHGIRAVGARSYGFKEQMMRRARETSMMNVW